VIVNSWTFKPRYLAFLAVICLAGCAQDQAHQQQSLQIGEGKEQEDVNAIDDAKCKSFGAALGSPEYARCRSNLDNQHVYFKDALAFPVLRQTSVEPSQR
jgi:hypothetical protein